MKKFLEICTNVDELAILVIFLQIFTKNIDSAQSDQDIFQAAIKVLWSDSHASGNLHLSTSFKENFIDDVLILL